MAEKVVEQKKETVLEPKQIVEEIKGVTLGKFEELKKEIDGIKSKIGEIETTVVERQTIVGETKGVDGKMEKKAFFEYLRKGFASPEVKALVEDANTSEVLVPPELYSTIVQSVAKMNYFRNLATVIPVKSNRLDKRDITDVLVGWGKLETGTAITESTPSVNKDTIFVHDMYGLVRLGENLLADSDVALESLITQMFAKAISHSEKSAFVIGDGVDKPKGVFLDTSIVQILTGATGQIHTDDLIELYFTVPEPYRSNGVWLVGVGVAKALKKLKDNTGNYIWDRDISGAPNGTILGRPVYIVDEIAGTGSGTNAVAFGDFKSGYIILDRQSITVQRLNELYATQGQIGIKVHYRVGGGVLNPDAIRILQIK